MVVRRKEDDAPELRKSSLIPHAPYFPRIFRQFVPFCLFNSLHQQIANHRRCLLIAYHWTSHRWIRMMVALEPVDASPRSSLQPAMLGVEETRIPSQVNLEVHRHYSLLSTAATTSFNSAAASLPPSAPSPPDDLVMVAHFEHQVEEHDRIEPKGFLFLSCQLAVDVPVQV